MSIAFQCSDRRYSVEIFNEAVFFNTAHSGLFYHGGRFYDGEYSDV
jgi:hypothetical protein